MLRFVHYVCFVLRSKGLSGVVPRLKMLLDRFDLSGKKMKAAVAEINRLGAEHDFKPAMIVPAVVLQRHKSLLSYASGSHLEFAIHGYTHKNHRPWSLEKQQEEIEKGKAVFDRLGMPYCGFRAPYLSSNADTNKALESCGMLWNSDQGIMWSNNEQLPRNSYSTSEAVEILYHPDDAAKTLAMPRSHGQMVCIPLVLPDDEILIDRMGIKDSDRLTGIWLDILEQTYARGDLFVLQLHPERFIFCGKPMDALLNHITNSNMRVWITDMCEITKWWKERSAFQFEITKQPDDRCAIRCECSDRAVVLVRNSPDTAPPFHNGYQRVSGKHFTLAIQGGKPCIGISPRCTPALLAFIEALGFAYEMAEADSGYSVFFGEHEVYASDKEIDILSRIERSDQPLLRYWLWPDGCQSAFATSHDLDCVTLADFMYRALGR
jgi:peptidoglycan/xylan/chitin deacetylase (PgdA/CDA1 family)